jgi:tungstate transport system ATP-binding protein
MHAPVSILPLRLQRVSLRVRDKLLLDDVSFALSRGRRVVLLGPNGAGKSLTLRLCHGLVRPSAGVVLWQGTPSGEKRRRHAMVFQRPVLLRRTAFANLVHAAGLAGLGFGDRRVRAGEALEHFGLTRFADRAARTLSGGEQQRLAIARAWALRPEVLFLDEPTAALDPAATRAVEETIRLCHADGMTILMTTHDLGQARRLADEVIFLHHGRLLEQTPADEFFERPRSEAARAFITGELLW